MMIYQNNNKLQFKISELTKYNTIAHLIHLSLRTIIYIVNSRNTKLNRVIVIYCTLKLYSQMLAERLTLVIKLGL